MEKILDGEIRIQTYIYNSEREKMAHIQDMEEQGWFCGRYGEYNLSPESTITAYSDEGNWKLYAEFFKKEENVKYDKPIRYETEVHWLGIYNPIDKNNK